MVENHHLLIGDKKNLHPNHPFIFQKKDCPVHPILGSNIQLIGFDVSTFQHIYPNSCTAGESLEVPFDPSLHPGFPQMRLSWSQSSFFFSYVSVGPHDLNNRSSPAANKFTEFSGLEVLEWPQKIPRPRMGRNESVTLAGFNFWRFFGCFRK